MTDFTSDQAIRVSRQLELDRLHGIFPNSPDRMLSALGHPGYGNDYARAVLNKWVTEAHLSLHKIIYGRLVDA